MRFIRVGQNSRIINLDQVAYVREIPYFDDDEAGGTVASMAVEVVFNQEMRLHLTGDDAEQFMGMLNRQTGVW